MSSRKVIKCEVFSRIVGYFRPTNNWNSGKLSEFNQRKDFTELLSMESEFAKESFLTIKI